MNPHSEDLAMERTPSSPPTFGKCRPRGRPHKRWPSSKQKKLLRLYICAQKDRLPLVEILHRLKDGTFVAKERNAQHHLRKLLPECDQRIDEWRPKGESAMRLRMQFLRSVRAERRLKAMRARHRQESLQPPRFLVPQGRLPCPYESARALHDGQTTTCLDPHLYLYPRAVFSSGQASFMQSGLLAAGLDTSTSLNGHPKAESLPDKSPKRKSRASIFSGISSGIASLARSSSSASTRGNDSASNDPLSKLSRSEFLSLLEASQAKAPCRRSPFPFRWKYSNEKSTTKELNGALVRICCSKSNVCLDGQGLFVLEDGLSETPGCVHKRLLRAINAQKEERDAFLQFSVTSDEANAVDKFGNTLLHVAARWGARVSILISILKHTDDVSLINDRGETFLHVYDPPSDSLFKPASFINLVSYLRSRGFDFCQRDVEKRTFLHNLVEKKEFPVETLHCVFQQVTHGSARFLMAKRSVAGERLWHCVRKNLEQQCPKLHRVFGDEMEFIRRYLPEFSDSETSGLGNSPCTSKSFWGALATAGPSARPHGTPPTPQLGHVKSNLEGGGPDAKRTPLMDLLHEIGSSGKEPKADDLEASMRMTIPTGQQRQHLQYRDKEGNTALHYAAEFGIVPAVKLLCRLKVSVNSVNNCGNTPLQLVRYAIQRTDVKSDINMEARYLRCAVVLIEAGAIVRYKVVNRPLIVDKYDTIFDGSENSIHCLMQQGVAQDCKGLHLLSSY